MDVQSDKKRRREEMKLTGATTSEVPEHFLTAGEKWRIVGHVEKFY
jgi:hypothetical protein